MEADIKAFVPTRRLEEELDLANRPIIEVFEATNALEEMMPQRRRLGAIACLLAAGMAAGGLVGTYEARTTQIQLLPGVEAGASFALGAGTTVAVGPLGSFYLPAARTKMPLVGEVGANITLERFSLSSKNMNEVASAIDSPRRIIEQPLEQQIVSHLSADLENGLVAGAVFAGTALALDDLRRRKKRVNNLDELRSIQSFKSYVGPDVMSLMSERLLDSKDNARRQAHTNYKKLIGAISLGAVLMSVPSAHRLQDLQPPSLLAMDKIDPVVTQGVGFLNGARVTPNSPLEQIINVGLPVVLSQKQAIDASYQRIVPRLISEEHRWSVNPSNRAWINNPNFLMALDNSNLHCSFPYETVVLPQITRLIQPKLIINSGDTMISSGSLPFESQCVTIQAAGLESAVKASGHKIYELTIKGEDDSEATLTQQRTLTILGPNKQPYRPIIGLDSFNNYQAKVDGISFVGGPDPRQHISGEPMLINNKVVDMTSQASALNASGQKLAKVACSLVQQGVLPILVVHNKQEAQAATNEGCISAALSSEGSWSGGASLIQSVSGMPITSLVEGTSSGANYNGFAPYGKMAYAAPSTIMFINKYTNQITATSQLIISKQGYVSISNVQPVASK